MPFHLYPSCGATLMPFTACAMGWGRNRILKVDKNSDSIKSRLWTKVHEVLGQCREPLVFFNVFAGLSTSCFVQKAFDIKCRSRGKPNKCKVFVITNFWEERLRLFYGRLLAQFTDHHLTKFGWVPYADLGLWRLAMKRNAEFTEGR